MSQNRTGIQADQRNHLDLQINLLSEQENTRMLEMLRAIAQKVGAEVDQDAHLQALSEETEPERLLKQIENEEK
jgi:uncharacterized membrane protein